MCEQNNDQELLRGASHQTLVETLEILTVALEEIQSEGMKYRDFLVVKLLSKRADQGLRDAHVRLKTN